MADVQVGISVYRQSLCLVQQAVESVLNQYGKYSIVCFIRVDGPMGCDSPTREWLTGLESNDNRIQVAFGATTLGTFGSYKNIFRNEVSRYLCQLDADDWLEPCAIEHCVDALEARPRSSFAYSRYKEVDRDGRFIRVGARTEKEFDLDRQLVQFNTFHLRVIRRSFYKAVGGYDENLKFTGDYDLSLKLAELSRPIYVPSVAYNYRLHGENTSYRKKRETIQEAFQVAMNALERREKQHLWELHLVHGSKHNSPYVSLTLKKGPFILAGMHRSGTSILALTLQRLGINLGNNLIGADQQNPDGYGEDQKVVDINRRALQRATIHGSRGWRDWGWSNTSCAAPMSCADDEWRNQAQQYLQKRMQSQHFWGWKDPRNTLLLEDWLTLEPDSKVIGIYRYPWEMIGALQRLTPPIFLKESGWCLEIWNLYNSYLLSFAEKHPERCVLVNSTAFVEDPLGLVDVTKNKWGWPVNDLTSLQAGSIDSLIRPGLHRGFKHDDPLIRLHLACSPRSLQLFERLEQIADLPSPLSLNKPASLHYSKSKVDCCPQVSIVITSFNQGDLLLDALASAERYRPADFSEIIIVDDGSNDRRTCEVLSCLSAQGYMVIRQRNKGLPSARNTGLKYAQGEIILFLDDDNRLLSPYFDKGLALMRENRSIDVIYGDRVDFGLKEKRVVVGQIDEKQLWQKNMIDNCALIRRSYIERCGGYCLDLTGLGFEDWDLWLSGLSHNQGLKMAYISEVCFEYRVRPDSMLQTLIHDRAKQQQVLRVLRERYGSRVGNGGFI